MHLHAEFLLSFAPFLGFPVFLLVGFIVVAFIIVHRDCTCIYSPSHLDPSRAPALSTTLPPLHLRVCSHSYTKLYPSLLTVLAKVRTVI